MVNQVMQFNKVVEAQTTLMETFPFLLYFLVKIKKYFVAVNVANHPLFISPLTANVTVFRTNQQIHILKTPHHASTDP